MQKLLHLLHQLCPLSPELSAALEQQLQHKTITRDQHFVKKGQSLRLTFYVESGLLRCYHQGRDGITTGRFLTDGDIYAVDPFDNVRTFSGPSVQALEDTEIWYLPHAQLEEIYRQFPEFNIHGRLLMQQYMQLAEKVRHMLQLPVKAERYQYFRDHFPKLVKRTPLVDLASYLQMSEFTLCRVRHALKQETGKCQ